MENCGIGVIWDVPFHKTVRSRQESLLPFRSSAERIPNDVTNVAQIPALLTPHSSLFPPSQMPPVCPPKHVIENEKDTAPRGAVSF